MNVRDSDICLISETWLKPMDNFFLHGFDVVRNDRLDCRGGGVAIFIRNSVKYRRIPLTQDCDGGMEACAIEVFLDSESLSIVSCYYPPSQGSTDTESWRRFFSQLPGKSFFGGDFNAHHMVWGDSHNCPNGNHIVESLENMDLCVLNNGDPTFHCAAHRSNSNIDLSIIHSSLILSSNWQVGDDPWGSDHFPIRIDINCRFSVYSPFNKKVRLHHKFTNWDLFRNLLDSSIKDNLENLNNCPDVLVRYSSFTSLIYLALEGLNHSHRNKKRKSKTNSADSNTKNLSLNRKPAPPSPWWNPSCDQLIKSRKLALNKYKETRCYTDFIAYKKAVARNRIELRRIKSESFKEFCNNLRKDTNPSYVWNKIKAFKHRFNCNHNAHEYNTHKIDSANQHILALCPAWVPTEPLIQVSENQNPFLDLTFNMQELKFVLDNLNIKSSPGLDNIDYKIISNLPDSALCILLDLYNDLYRTRSFPREWHEFSVFFIPKAGSSKMRPISVASCLCKTLERIICNRFLWWLEHL